MQVATVRGILAADGFSGLFTGLGAEYVKSCINTFTYFLTRATPSSSLLHSPFYEEPLSGTGTPVRDERTALV